VPALSAAHVAHQHRDVVATIFALRKRLREIDADMRRGEWDRHRYGTHTVAGDVIGLFGCGAIGQELAGLCQGLDLPCIAFDPYIDDAKAPSTIEFVETKAALFERADIVSIHTPLTPETAEAVGAAELSALGSDGLLVNTARGAIVVEQAVVDAIRKDMIAGAAIDVFAKEPPDPDHQFFELDRVLTTPHLAGNTVESLASLSRGAAEKVQAVHDGRLPAETVNAEAIELQTG